MTNPERFIVQILGPAGVSVGMGFIAGERHIVTCAHVVNAAVGRAQRENTRPGNTWLSVEFPFAGGPDERIVRQATVDAWLPEEGMPFDLRDVAGLYLSEGTLPTGCEPATLADSLGSDQAVQLKGPVSEPALHRGGGHVTGRLVGRADRARLQVDQEIRGIFRAKKGYSGGPVWDQQTGRVVGIVQAVPVDERAVNVHVIDNELLIEGWPEVLYRPPPCPYRGLNAFTAADSDLFFGREAFVRELVQAVTEEPVLVLFGPSGSGKSSVLAAGLVPNLLRSGSRVAAFCRPGANPLLHLAESLAVAAGHLRPVALAELDSWVDRLRTRGLADTADFVLAATGTSGLLVVIDQFEQFFTSGTTAEHRAELARLLNELVRDRPAGVQLALSIRSEYLGELVSLEGPFGRFAQKTAHRIPPLDADQLRSAVVGPVLATKGVRRVEIEEGLDHLICEEFLGGPGELLPLLEFTLTRLWEIQRGSRLTLQDYRALGGVAGALTHYAEECYGVLSSAQQKDAARRIFTELEIFNG
ncbi:serine protease [Streptomyces sp. Tue6028]|uniref:serine protease n=1 Tax=Streptomyces sp. Tue6028 TaxID=2036037 RepID=UPI003EBB66DB